MIKTLESKLQIFNQKNMRYSAYKMLNYLDETSLSNLYHSMQHPQQNIAKNSYFIKLIQGLILTKKYLNKVDRSLYYYYYEENFIAQTDYINTLSLIQKNSTICSNLMKQYNNLFSMLKTKCSINDYQIGKLQQIVCDSDLALPNNLRQNVGKFCNSPFQFYVCSLLNAKSYGDIDMETNFQNLKAFLQQKQQIYLKQIIKFRSNSIQEQKDSIQKILKIRLNPSQTYNTINLVIEGFQLHNLIVILLGLADQILSTFKTYINSIEDPFNKFVQFNLRYSVYRNFVIQAQQNFGFAFKLYNGIFEDGFNCQISATDFTFSKICINKFKKMMHEEMKQIMPIYAYLTQKYRQKEQAIHLQPNQIILQSNILSFIGSSSEEYFTKCQEGLLMCLEQFVQVFVDLSVDQSNISNCGHSKMNISGAYELLQATVIGQSLSILNKINSLNLSSQQIQQKIQLQLKTLQKLNIKPVTLRKLCEKINKIVEEKEIEIHYNYIQKDNILENLNRKSHKYSIPKSTQMQNKMVSSQITDDSSNNSDNEQWQYTSDMQDQVLQEIEYFQMDTQ